MSKIKGFDDTISWYNSNAQQYAEASKDYQFLPAIEKFSNLVTPGGRVLDAGCGSGRDSVILKSKGFDVTGLDISSGLIEVAKKEHPDIDFVKGDFLKIPFENSFFDGIWAHAALVHLETIQQTQIAINEFQRVLKDKGVLHIFVKQQLDEHKTAIVSDKLSKHDRFFQYYTKEEIDRLLKKAGFSVVFIEENVNDPSGRPEVKWVWTLARKTNSLGNTLQAS